MLDVVSGNDYKNTYTISLGKQICSPFLTVLRNFSLTNRLCGESIKEGRGLDFHVN